MKPIPENVQNLINQYDRSQKNLIEMIATKTARGNSTIYRKRILAGVNAELSSLNEYSAKWVKTELPKSYKTGIDKSYAEFRKQNIPTELVAPNNIVVANLVDNMVGQLSDATQFVGRRIKDDLRKAGVAAVADKLATGSTVKQTKQNLLTRLSDDGIVSILDKRGRPIRLDAYASMIARTTTREATNRGAIQQVQDSGSDLVQMTTHFSTCPICAPLEGRVYSISGKSAEYPPLNKAFGGGYSTIHPNCFIDPQVPIFTSKGWVSIGKVKVGNLVLTHTGKFRKVTKLHRNIGSPNIVKISINNRHSKGVYNNLTVTTNHPILINDKWVDAIDAKLGDKIKILSHPCENCGRPTPIYNKTCSKKCGEEVLRVLANHNDEYVFIDAEITSISTQESKRTHTLYNLSVAKDESYVAKGFTVHNCQHSIVPYFPEMDDDSEKLKKESNRAFEISKEDQKSIDSYNKQQAIKQERRMDRNEWEKSTLLAPVQTPKTFSGFRSVKRADGKRYEDIRIAIKT